MNKSITTKSAAALLAAALLITGCAKKDGKDAAGAEGKAPGAAAGMQAGRGAGGGRGGFGPAGGSAPKTAVAEMKPITLVREYVGEVTPAYSVDLRSTTSGWMKSISVDIGSRVTKGQPICVIDHDDLQAQAEQSKASIASAEASVARAQAELQQAHNENERAKALYSKGIISKNELEDAETTKKQMQASLDAAKAQLAQSKAALKAIEIKLRDTTILAPFSGIVAERFIDAGAYVSPSTSIVTIIDDSAVKVVVNVIEDDLPKIRTGAAADVATDAWPDRKFAGRVLRISPSVAANSRTAAVEILIPNSGGALKSGMMARVSLIASRKPSALVIPEAALNTDPASGGKYVNVMGKDGPERRDVGVGIETSAEIEITHGLSAGDKVAIGSISSNGGSGRGPGGSAAGGTGRQPKGGAK